MTISLTVPPNTVIRRGRGTVPRSVALCSALVIGSGAALLFGAPDAAAHNELVRSSPADGATLTERPARVTLTFAENLSAATIRTALTADGKAVASAGKVVVSANAVTQPMPAAPRPGRYTLAYRLISRDEHPVTGSVTFRIAPAASNATSAPQRTDTPRPATESPTPAGGSGGASRRSPASGSGTDATSTVVYLWIGIAGLALLGAGVAVAVLRRRSRLDTSR